MAESSVKVSVKWGKFKYDDVEIGLDDALEVFQLQLYSLTNVLPEKQKILTKGQMIKPSTNWRTLGVKNGHQFVLMGTAESTAAPETAPAESSTAPVAEKPTEVPEVIERKYPVGLINLGNTCYMNATLQCLATVPELIQEMSKLTSDAQGLDGNTRIVSVLSQLFRDMKSAPNAIPPFVFWTALKLVFPQFSQTTPAGQPMQQDAEECWSQLVTSIKQRFGQATDNAVDKLFGGEFETKISCTEGDESPQTSIESFFKLSCHISAATNHLLEGLTEGLEESITKHSAALGRDALFKKSSRISKLPPYLTVSFVRFFWKPKERVKAKILRAVRFQHTLDVFNLCTDELKAKLQGKRQYLRDLADTSKKGDAMEVSKEAPSEFPQNDTGMYELCAILTHIGRSADSGHYVAWVKDDESKAGDWLKFDDENVSIVSSEEIHKLQGGGDWHIAYICLYRTKKN